MRIYAISLGAGVLVGVIYGLLNVRSPAPPVVALVGLLGILIGEQIIPLGKQFIAGTSFAAAWQHSQCTKHIFGNMPGRHAEAAKAASTIPSPEARS